MLVSSPIFDFLFKASGWKLVGNIPRDLKKTVVIVCPHATWKDFPIGLGARDTLRLEMGFCLYGNDIDDTTSPLEAGLGWITKFSKTFTNSENLAAQKAAGVTKKLVGFEMIDRGIPRHHYVIKDAAGNAIGTVTSGTQAPSLGKAIGLGYVSTAHAAVGSEIFIDIRNTLVKAQVVKFPFK
mgnify:CR=1 FL=1